MTDNELRDALGQLKNDIQEAAKIEFNDSLQKAVADIDARMDKIEAAQQTAALGIPPEQAVSREFRDYLTSGAIDGSVVRRYKDTDPTAGTSGNSGILIPKPIVQRIVEYSTAGNPLRELADIVSISVGDTYAAADELGAVGTGWVGETDSRTGTDAQTYGSIEIPLREIYAEPKYSNRLLADAEFNLEERIVRAIARAFSAAENTGFFSGSGSKQPAGLLNATVVSDANWQPGKVGKIEAASGSAITGDDIINLVNSLDDKYIDNAALLMNRTIWNAIRQLKSGASGANRYLLWTPDIVNGRLVRSLMGIPVYLASAMPSSIAAGNITIALGDFRQAYTIAEKANGMSMIRDDVTSKGYTKFYTSKRIGGGLTNTEAVKFLVQPGSSSGSASAPASASASGTPSGSGSI